MEEFFLQCDLRALQVQEGNVKYFNVKCHYCNTEDRLQDQREEHRKQTHQDPREEHRRQTLPNQREEHRRQTHQDQREEHRTNSSRLNLREL